MSSSDVKALLQTMAWGEVSPSPWVKFEGWIEPSPTTRTTRVVIRVESLEHDVTEGSSKHKIVRPWLAVETDFQVGDLEIHHSPSVGALWQTLLSKAVKELAFSLREHDPRIGTVLAEGVLKDFLPRCPLFDPPRIRPPAWKRGAGIDAAPCPLCSDGFGQGYPAMWGGGNLMWVHPSCWRRVYE